MGWSPLTTWFPYTSPAEISRACRRGKSERLHTLGICCSGRSAWGLHLTLRQASRSKCDLHESQDEEILPHPGSLARTRTLQESVGRMALLVRLKRRHLYSVVTFAVWAFSDASIGFRYVCSFFSQCQQIAV